MKYGINADGLFYVEYTSCSRPVGNMRQELNIACERVAKQGPTIISLSSGLDSQIILHSFVEQNLDYQCAFLHWVGVNDFEYDNIKILEKKYGFKTQIVVIDPEKIKDQIQKRSNETGIPPQHHISKMFFDQLDPDCQILEGIESANQTRLPNGRWCLIESLHGIDIVADWFHRDRKSPVVHIDRRSPCQELAVSMLIDDIAQAYRNAFTYIENNNLVEQESNKKISFLTRGWEFYVKPLLLGKYWKNELEYFPKFASQQKIKYINEPSVRHNYFERAVLVDIEKFLDVMCDWGSGRQLKVLQHDFSKATNYNTQEQYASLKAKTFKEKVTDRRKDLSAESYQ